MNQKVVRSFLILVAAQKFSLGWHTSIYVLFLLSNGLSLLEANLINTCFMVAGFLLDPATGRLADQIGQKKVYTYGVLAWSLACLVYGLGHSFSVFLIAELIAAVGAALISQALESWVRNVTDEATSHQAISLAGSISWLAMVPGSILGSLIGAIWGLSWPWFISAALGLITALLADFLLRHLPEGKDDLVTDQPNLSTRQIATLTLNHPALRFTSLIVFVVGATTMPFNMFWAPVLKDLSGQAWWLGFVWIGVAVSLSAGSYWAKSRHNGHLSFALAAIGLPMLLPVFLPHVLPVTTFFILHEFGRGAVTPLVFTYSNRHIDNRHRSTANSIRTAIGTLGNAFGLVISGLLSKSLSPLAIWLISALALITLAIYAKKKT